MKIFEFTDRLCRAIEARGISPKDCEDYIKRIEMSLSDHDVEKATDSDIEEAADVCVEFLLKKSHTDTAEVTRPAADDQIEPDDFADVKETDDPLEKTQTYSVPVPHSRKIVEEPVIVEETPEPAPDERIEEKISGAGVFRVILITFLASPLWAVAAAVFFAPFIALFAAEIAITVAFIALLAGGSAAGTATSLTGIVYGVVQMFSVPSVGLYEIGFGIILVGITFIFGILSYNGAVRLMPFVFRKTGHLLKLVFSKVKPLLNAYARRCAGL